jgi:CBS domain-containing protein
MENIKVKDIMTPHPVTIKDYTSLTRAAEKMREINCGILLIGNEDSVYGVITDRDIVVRAIAANAKPEHTIVKEVMSIGVLTCDEGDSMRKALDIMLSHDVGRLLVKNSEGKIVGIITLGSIIRHAMNKDKLADIISHAAEAH